MPKDHTIGGGKSQSAAEKAAGLNRLAGITEIGQPLLAEVFQVNLYSAVALNTIAIMSKLCDYTVERLRCL